MAKACKICGKSVRFGRRKRHHHAAGWMYRAPRTSKKWKPSLRNATITVDGVKQKVKVCMKCYKNLLAKGLRV
ncbi:MAG: L28 family ribosomal protein [Patescibacteria group bacterium]|nr:L28 family ribosomal protein [Patescibacteria group bacterium]